MGELYPFVLKGHDAPVGTVEKVDGAQKRRLPCPARADEREDIAFLQLKRDASQYFRVAERFP